MHHSAKGTFRLTTLCGLIALTACGNQPSKNPVLISPFLQWTASWVSGTQTGLITYQSTGQTVTLSVNTTGATIQPPYNVKINGICVTASSSTISTSVQLTSEAAGQCSVQVEASTLNITVP